MTVSWKKWSSAAGRADEAFFVLGPPGQGSFAQQLDRCFELYRTAVAESGVDRASAVAATVFLSDAANQEAELRAHPGFAALGASGAAITVIEQPPAAAKIGLFAYHVDRAGRDERRRLTLRGAKPEAAALAITAEPYRFYYLKNLISHLREDAAAQTVDLLGVPGFAAQSEGIGLDQVVRTWFYVHDIDTHYRSVSRARNHVFDRFGITFHTGFPASTGIGGRSADPADLVVLDLIAIDGLQPGQCRRMEAPTHMNPTVEYQVTFERGRELSFGDRRHLYVSGTASIDNRGQILHLGDVCRQTRRAIENIAALLGNSGAALGDLQYLIVYLRDPVDAELVAAELESCGLGGLPHIVVHAPVCRPGWLVEFEGVAVDAKGDARFAAF